MRIFLHVIFSFLILVDFTSIFGQKLTGTALEENKKIVSQLTELVTHTPKAEEEAPEYNLPADILDQARFQIQYLKQLEENLVKLEKSTETKIQQLEAAQSEIKNLLKEEKTLQEIRANRVSAIYENMKPDKAAEVLQSLTEAEATKILQRLNPRHAGKILEALPSQTSLKYTRLILSWSAQKNQGNAH